MGKFQEKYSFMQNNLVVRQNRPHQIDLFESGVVFKEGAMVKVLKRTCIFVTLSNISMT